MTTKIASPNPRRDRDFVNAANIFDEHKYPMFFHKIEFEKFRQIEGLTSEFKNPISVISGVNKSGKTTILLSIACSHYNFKRIDLSTGVLRRSKWGDVMKFSKFDQQNEDWTYHVEYRVGNKPVIRKGGQRKHLTSKWNGVAKKESQIGVDKGDKGRTVVLVDLERILPSRMLSVSNVNKIRKITQETPLDKAAEKKSYLSYIFESDYGISSLSRFADKEVYSFESNNCQYTSFNTASGEDVLTRIISDVVDADKSSLILIEEIEVGLHPKIQRRLMDVIFHESQLNKKQFIITTHSPTILSSVDPSSRIFIESSNNEYRSIQGISVNQALSRMDSYSYPLFNLFVEDEESKKIVIKAIKEINREKKHLNVPDLINIVVSGSADNTYANFQSHIRTFKSKRLECGHACILDGDMRKEKRNSGEEKYPEEDGLFFLYSSDSPELFLTKEYLKKHSNSKLDYHVKSSDPHILFFKMVEEKLCSDSDEAFEKCWECFIDTQDGRDFMSELVDFLLKQYEKWKNPSNKNQVMA